MFHASLDEPSVHVPAEVQVVEPVRFRVPKMVIIPEAPNVRVCGAVKVRSGSQPNDPPLLYWMACAVVTHGEPLSEPKDHVEPVQFRKPGVRPGKPLPRMPITSCIVLLPLKSSPGVTPPPPPPPPAAPELPVELVIATAIVPLV